MSPSQRYYVRRQREDLTRIRDLVRDMIDRHHVAVLDADQLAEDVRLLTQIDQRCQLLRGRLPRAAAVA